MMLVCMGGRRAGDQQNLTKSRDTYNHCKLMERKMLVVLLRGFSVFSLFLAKIHNFIQSMCVCVCVCVYGL